MAKTPAPGRSSTTGRSRSTSAASGVTRPRWRRWVWWLALPGLFLGLALVAFLFVLMVQVPLPEDIAPGATTVLDRDGEVVGTLTGETTRRDVEFGEIPETTRLAVLAAEDRDFYTHGGIAPLGILRAAVTNLRAGDVEQGGSTITQQYVKNAVVGTERSYYRKMREAALAIKVDREYPKNTVLEWYLDTIYWGRGAYGIGAAAQTYYGVGASELDLNQSATLAGIISSPENLDPAENPQGADGRRQYVLGGMLEEGWITQAEHDRAVAAGLPEVTQNTALSTTTAPYYLDAVRRELTRELGDRAVAGNLRVYTGLDLRAQQAAERVVRDSLASSELAVDGVTAAVVSVDPATGEVRTVVGGPDFGDQPLNTAVQSRRQIGSTFKAFTLAAWLEAGLSPESRLESPAALQIGDIEVNDYANQDRGTLTVFQALAQSANTVFVQMQQQLGADPIIDVATRLGLPETIGQDERPAFQRGATMTLGQDSFRPIEVAEAYNTIAAEGVHTDAHTIVRVEDADGNVVFEADPGEEAVLSANDARTATEAMRRVISEGTGSAADIGRPAAGKTGTTSQATDGWFAGYTPQLTTVAWVGHLDNDPVEGLSGGNLPATIWQQVMTTALEGVEATDFAPPDLSQYEILNEAPEPCPEGYTEAGAAEEQPTAPPDGGPEGSGEPAPAETRTEIAPGTEDREGGPCIRVVVEQPSPSPTETESETETETETELPTETEPGLLPTEEEPTEEPTTEEPTQEPTEEPTTEEPTSESSPTEGSTSEGP